MHLSENTGIEFRSDCSSSFIEFLAGMRNRPLKHRRKSEVGYPRLGRILGPQGKMPSPKAGTVVEDVATAVQEFAAGKAEFRNDDGGNIHAIVGKASFEPGKLVENIEAFVDPIRRMRPAAAKGTYIKKACICLTMSPSIQLDLSA